MYGIDKETDLLSNRLFSSSFVVFLFVWLILLGLGDEKWGRLREKWGKGSKWALIDP